MKILILLPNYFPKQNPRVFRWQALAEHWVKQGWQVHFLCAKHPAHPDAEQLNGVMVHRAGYANLMDFRYALLGIQQRRDEAGAAASQDRPGFFARAFHWFWRQLYWPDGSWIWIRPAKKRALQLLSGQSFDAMLSVSLPFSSHRVALACHRRYPRLRWLADIGDPFAFSFEIPKNNHLLYRRLNFWAERRVLLSADVVSVTFEGARQEYRRFFLESASKMQVIPPLFQRPEPSELSSKIRFEAGKIHLGYFGTFYKNVRTPEGFLNLLRAVLQQKPEISAQLLVHFIGYMEPPTLAIFERYPELCHIIRLHGLLPKKLAFALMQQCDFLLNVGNLTRHQLPSKSVDYLLAGKPIVNIAMHEEDTFVGFLHEHPMLLNLVPEQHRGREGQAAELLAFLEKMKGKELGKEALEAARQRFSVEGIAALYEQLLRGD